MVSNLPAVAITGAALVVCIVNLAYLKHRLAWRSAANAFAGTLGAVAAGVDHFWWFLVPWLLLTLWGLIALTMPAPDPADLNERMAEAFTEWAKREGMPGTVNEARSFMAGYVKGRADLRQAKGARR